MGAVRKAVTPAVPSAVVPLKQTSEGVAPYKESTETADYLGANPVVLVHGEDVNPSGNRYWDTSGDIESTTNQDFAPSIPGPSALPGRVEPMTFGGSAAPTDTLMGTVQAEQAPYQDSLDQWTQESQRLDNNGTQSTNNTGQMTSYPSPDGETWRVNDLGTQTKMQGFTETAPGSLGFNMQQDVPTPQAANSLPPNSGALNDSVFGAIWQGTGSTTVDVNTAPSTAPAAAAPTYAPLGWG